jgi:hypothetical protein
MALLSQAIADQVAIDQQPRQATADDGSVHMLFLDGGVVRSVLLNDWPAEQLALAARDAVRIKRQALRVALRSAAQAHAGKRAGQLTLPELRDLVLILLEERGLLDEDGKVV